MKPISAALAVIIVTTMLGGCSSKEQPRESGGTVIVAGGRSNMPVPKLTGRSRDWVAEAALSRDKFAIVGVSGRPRLLHQETIEHNCDSDATCEGVTDDYLKDTDQRLSRVKADSAEADTLGALIEAGRQLGPDLAVKRIIVIDSGLQTVGRLQMQDPGAFRVDPARVVEGLKDNRDFRSLQDAEILWVGIGAAADPQPPIDAEQRLQLQELWTGILEAAGARVVFDPAGLTGSGRTGLPKVTVVEKELVPEPSPLGCIELRNDQIGFKPNRAEFVDPAKAKEILTKVAEQLKKNPIEVSVIGTTAEADPPPLLSEERAKAVVALLRQMGVTNRMHAIGVGNNFTGYEEPRGPSGEWIETKAMKMRKVMIQPAGGAC